MPTQDTTAPVTLDELRSGPTTLSVERAGQFLGVSRGHAYDMVRNGLLPAVKLGPRRVRIPSAALLRILTGEQ